MSLDYDTRAIVDRDVHFPADADGKMADTLHVLIWASMATDIGSITKDNYLEACDRYNRWSMLVGPQFNRITGLEPEPFIPTVLDWKNAIGLATNVANTSRREWNKRLQEAIARG